MAYTIITQVSFYLVIIDLIILPEAKICFIFHNPGLDVVVTPHVCHAGDHCFPALDFRFQTLYPPIRKDYKFILFIYLFIYLFIQSVVRSLFFKILIDIVVEICQKV